MSNSTVAPPTSEAPHPSAGGVEAGLTAVTCALDATLSTCGSRSLSDAELVGAIRAVEVISRKISALQHAMAAEVDERSTPCPDIGNISWDHGCRSAVELLQQLTQVSRFTAARQIRHGAKLSPRQGFSGEVLDPHYGDVADALSDGTLGAESARIIIDTLDRTQHKIPPAEQPIAERYLVAGATGGLTDEGTLPDEGTPFDDGSTSCTGLPEHADEVKVRAKSLALYFDQDGIEPKIDRAAIRRGFRFGAERDGLVPVTGALLPETAALLARLFDSINSPRTASTPAPPVRDAARDESFTHYNTGANTNEYVPFDPEKPGRTVRFEPAAEPDDAAPGARTGFEARTASEPTATTKATATTKTTEATEATEVDFQVMHETDTRTADQKRHDALATVLATAAKHPDTPNLGGAPVTVLIQATEETLDPTTRSGIAWLHDHDGSATPSKLSAVRHAACTGSLQRITQDTHGRIIDLETPHRVFNANQRRAIMLRDGGCIIPGCTVPATWCEIHHITEWTKGGKTHTDNGVLMCFFHHRYLEASGWNVRMRNGVPQVRPPERLHGNTLWWSVRPATRPPALPRISRVA